MLESKEIITLAKGLKGVITKEHRFTTDSVLLSRFSAPKKNDVVAEFCCGCGAISLLWFAEDSIAPKAVVGFEISQEGSAIFKEAVALNSLEEKIKVENFDLKNYKANPIFNGSFNSVVFNPPYFPVGFGDGSRQTARQESDVTINELCAAAAKALKYGGNLYVCYKPSRVVALFYAMRNNKIEPKEIRPVLIRPDQPPHLFLVKGKLGAGEQLNWLEPWVLQNSDGTPSRQYAHLYHNCGI